MGKKTAKERAQARIKKSNPKGVTNVLGKKNPRIKSRKARIAKRGLDWLVTQAKKSKDKSLNTKDIDNLIQKGLDSGKVKLSKDIGIASKQIGQAHNTVTDALEGSKRVATNTAAKNKRRLAVMRAKEDRLAGIKPPTETMSKKEIRKRSDRNKGWRPVKLGAEAQISSFAARNGLPATIKKFGKEAVDKIKAKYPTTGKRDIPKTVADTQRGIPLTGRVGSGPGGLSFKSGGKIIAKNGGGSAKPEKIPAKVGKITPRIKSRKARIAKKGLDWLVTKGKQVGKDLNKLEGRTWTGKRKVPKNPKRPVIARREDSIQLKSGKIITPEGGVKNYKLKPGEKKVSRVKGNVIPGKGRKRPGVGRLQKSASLKKVADIDKKVTQRNIRRFGTRALAIAAGAYTVKKIVDAIKKPPMAATDTSSSGGSRTVKSGQTLSQIAKDNGTTLKALLAANPSIKNANKIKVGQKIKLSKPVKKRKSVYQGMKKSEMKKIAMPKKKKGGGTVFRRGGGKALRGFGNATYSNKLY